VADATRAWTLEGFDDRLEAWIERESPRTELTVNVATWVMTRYDNPYQGVRRAEGFENLWFAVLPGSRHGAGKVVVCAYWIEELQHVVRCASIATLNEPV
jgi:hypothetical protein